MSFNAFDLHHTLKSNVDSMGYTVPTQIQSEAIPVILEGRDVLGLAQTGTGKTAAFGLPMLNRLRVEKKPGLRGLVIAPTRELAEQIHDALFDLSGGAAKHALVTLYGGVGINPQIAKLAKNAQIAVACPGRLLDHIQRGTINLKNIEVLVLDEADQMFDMGFLPAIREIVRNLPKHRQTLLFSATMPEEVRTLAAEMLTNPVTVEIGLRAPVASVAHALYPVPGHLKSALLVELLKDLGEGSVLVFTRTKHRAQRLDQQLRKAGYKAASIQGNLSQNRRQEAMDGFRAGTYRILVATDIAARGIDVNGISHVINFDMPDTVDAYTHRIGRTGRAAANGDAFTFVTPDDDAMIRRIEMVLKDKIKRRLIDGFDYDVPPPSGAVDDGRRQARHHGRQPGRSSRGVAASGNRGGGAGGYAGESRKHAGARHGGNTASTVPGGIRKKMRPQPQPPRISDIQPTFDNSGPRPVVLTMHQLQHPVYGGQGNAAGNSRAAGNKSPFNKRSGGNGGNRHFGSRSNRPRSSSN